MSNLVYTCVCRENNRCLGCIAADEISRSAHLKIERDRARHAIAVLAREARRIVSIRACVCNEPSHRCGTNLMLDDINTAVGLGAPPSAGEEGK